MPTDIVPMDEDGSRKRARTHSVASTQTAAQDGADEAGSGLAVTRPPRQVPHCWNNNFTVRLTYSDNFTHSIQNNSSTAVAQYFRTNSIYDPDVSNTGHQPFASDLWKGMYEYYTVLACKATVRLYNCYDDVATYTLGGLSKVKPGCVNVGFLATTNSADYVTSGGAFPLCEMKNVSSMFLTPLNYLEYSHTYTPGDFLVDAKDADNDQTWTPIGSNSAVSRNFGYVISPGITGTASLAGVSPTPVVLVQAQVILEYTVQFTQVAQTFRVTPS